MTILSKIGFLSAASFVTLLTMGISIAPALAETPIDITAEKVPPARLFVSYADRDFASKPAEQVLERQIRKAAQSLCGAWGSRSTLSHVEIREIKRCRTEAFKGAYLQLQAVKSSRTSPR
jgi:UrcA family protein